MENVFLINEVSWWGKKPFWSIPDFPTLYTLKSSDLPSVVSPSYITSLSKDNLMICRYCSCQVLNVFLKCVQPKMQKNCFNWQCKRYCF